MAKTNKRQNDLMDRQSFQNSESYPKQETDLPKDRFQDVVQTATASQTNTNAADFTNKGEKGPEASSLVARTATSVKKKMSIRPSSETDLEASKIVGGVPLGDSASTMSVAGAPAVGISNDQSRVPYSRGGVRANERYGKKISTDNFVINNVVCEQIAPSFEEPKDLREAPDALQGYNGRKQFKTARGKKVYGDHPGATLYERSVDFIDHSAIVHATGQIISDISDTSNYPANLNDDENFVTVKKGNYLLEGLKLTIADGHITNIAFDEKQYVVPQPAEALEQANMNWQVDANNVAKAMVKLQTELGRETTDKWSPLGYVIDQPYQFGMLFHDGEAILGSLTGGAYKTAAHSLAFLQNKMAKEGVRNLASIKEWMTEDLVKAIKSDVYEGASKSDIFNQDFYRRGAASAIINMFDSTGKYTSKADFINQPRSLKFHLQTVDNNINPFHAKKEFYKALDKVMLFSTDDGNYNPVLPIHITDQVKVMVPYSLNAWLKGWKNPFTNAKPASESHGCFFRETGITKGCSYEYSDIRNKYSWEYVDPFVAGLCRWLLRHENSVVRTYGDGEAYLPIHFTNTTANAFSYMVCSASQDMAWMRNLIFRDYLFAGEQGVYVWEDLSSLSELNPLYSSQYKYNDYGSALQLGTLHDVAKLKIYWPEMITPRQATFIDTEGSNEVEEVASYYLPYYFNENAINAESASGIDADNGGVMSFPIIRQGVNHDYVDFLYSMTERDVRLAIDRMVTVPVSVAVSNGNVYTGTNIGDSLHYSALRYDTNSDGRVVVTFSPDATVHGLTEATYLCTPRELGYLFPLPVSLGKAYTTTGEDKVARDVVNPFITGGYSTAMTVYHANGSVQTGSIIDRAASLSQSWERCFADNLLGISAYNNAFVQNNGIVPAIGCFINSNITYSLGSGKTTVNYSLLSPQLYKVPALYGIQAKEIENTENIKTGAPSYVGNNTVFSLAKFMWTMMQRVYTPINPFEAAWAGTVSDGGFTVPTNIGVETDPLECAMYFGFAGCLGSDFNQDILDRLTKKDELGMYYYEDEFIKSSLIFN
jgi:hypothetical protein